MSQKEYILRSLSKIRHKRYEHYVVNRIFHRLCDPELEFICQQLVRRSNGKIALTDLFFPQLHLHLEVDEVHHKLNIDADALRSQDIISETGHEIVRIDVDKSLLQIDIGVDQFIEKVRAQKHALIDSGTFVPWDYDRGYAPEPHMERGTINAHDQVVFRYQRDALRLFGYTGGHWQKGLWFLPNDKTRMVWFPRLWNHGPWKNKLSDDGEFIFEDAGEQNLADYRKPENDDFVNERIVFARWKNPLGQPVYRFTGVFSKDKNKSAENLTAFRKVQNKIDLHRYKNAPQFPTGRSSLG